VLKRPVWGLRRASRAEFVLENQSAPSSATRYALKGRGIGVLMVTASVSWLSRMIWCWQRPVPATTQIEPNAATGGER